MDDAESMLSDGDLDALFAACSSDLFVDIGQKGNSACRFQAAMSSLPESAIAAHQTRSFAWAESSAASQIVDVNMLTHHQQQQTPHHHNHHGMLQSALSHFGSAGFSPFQMCAEEIARKRPVFARSHTVSSSSLVVVGAMSAFWQSLMAAQQLAFGRWHTPQSDAAACDATARRGKAARE
uniref:Uncharacterized protein n=1 Tax=Plectus sambesii TaxID=2011161 RepID=A0A914WZW6_9BILA